MMIALPKLAHAIMISLVIECGVFSASTKMASRESPGGSAICGSDKRHMLVRIGIINDSNLLA
jgi:hypothetical protein